MNVDVDGVSGLPQREALGQVLQFLTFIQHVKLVVSLETANSHVVRGVEGHKFVCHPLAFKQVKDTLTGRIRLFEGLSGGKGGRQKRKTKSEQRA